METKEKYNKVKSMLKEKRQRGDVLAIAKILAMHPVYISNLLSPANDLYNDQVIAEAAKLISQREKSTDSMLKKLGI